MPNTQNKLTPHVARAGLFAIMKTTGLDRHVVQHHRAAYDARRRAVVELAMNAGFTFSHSTQGTWCEFEGITGEPVAPGCNFNDFSCYRALNSWAQRSEAVSTTTEQATAPLNPRELVPDDTLRELAKTTKVRMNGQLSEDDQRLLAMVLPDLCGELLGRRLSMEGTDTDLQAATEIKFRNHAEEIEHARREFNAA